MLMRITLDLSTFNDSRSKSYLLSLKNLFSKGRTVCRNRIGNPSVQEDKGLIIFFFFCFKKAVIFGFLKK
jgi:hypothetical protein